MYFNDLINGFPITRILSAYTIFSEKVVADITELSASSDPELLKIKLQELEDVCNESRSIDVNLAVSLNAQKETITQCYRTVFKLKTPGKTNPPGVMETAKTI
jgi:hypothetical protein